MASNGIWNLVDLPDGAKAIGCKYVFKIEKDSLGNIERFFCIIMTLAAHFDLGLQQIDVKIAFLSGNLEEEVYLKQLKGFSSSSGEHLVTESKICFLVLYVDDILLATNDKGLLHEGDRFNLDQCPKNDLEWEQIKNIPYASTVGSLMYARFAQDLPLHLLLGC
ncbi:hypothetical protein AAG906_005768 [Vitis piasezkii]